MPLTPQQALEASPAAKLTDEERKQFEEIKESIDESLRTVYQGGMHSGALPACNVRVAAYIARAYQIKFWNVQMQPLNGRMGTAEEILKAGGEVQWFLTMAPDWRASV